MIPVEQVFRNAQIRLPLPDELERRRAWLALYAARDLGAYWHAPDDLAAGVNAIEYGLQNLEIDVIDAAAIEELLERAAPDVVDCDEDQAWSICVATVAAVVNQRLARARLDLQLHPFEPLTDDAPISWLALSTSETAWLIEHGIAAHYISDDEVRAHLAAAGSSRLMPVVDEGFLAERAGWVRQQLDVERAKPEPNPRWLFEHGRDLTCVLTMLPARAAERDAALLGAVAVAKAMAEGAARGTCGISAELWLDAWGFAMCARAQPTIDALLAESVVSRAGTEPRGIDLFWAPIVRAFVAVTRREMPSAVRAAITAISASDDRVVPDGMMEHLYIPVLEMLERLGGDAQAWTDAVRRAYEQHERWWREPDNYRDCGFAACMVAGVVALARERGVATEVTSDFAPAAWLDGTLAR